MTEHENINNEFAELEEIIRAAGDYIEVSDDLRPRILEDARSGLEETSTRFWIAGLAIAVIVFAIFANHFRGQMSSPLNSAMTPTSAQLYAEAQRKTSESNADASWTLVDSFSELRQRQAGLINGSL